MTSSSTSHRRPFAVAGPAIPSHMPRRAQNSTAREGPQSPARDDLFLEEMEAIVARMEPRAHPPHSTHGTSRTGGTRATSLAYVKHITATADDYRQRIMSTAPPPSPPLPRHMHDTRITRSHQRRVAPTPQRLQAHRPPEPASPTSTSASPLADRASLGSGADVSAMHRGKSKSPEGVHAPLVGAGEPSCVDGGWPTGTRELARLALASDSSAESSLIERDASSQSTHLSATADVPESVPSAMCQVSLPVAVACAHRPAEHNSKPETTPPTRTRRLIIASTRQFLLVEDTNDALAATREDNHYTWYTI